MRTMELTYLFDDYGQVEQRRYFWEDLIDRYNSIGGNAVSIDDTLSIGYDGKLVLKIKVYGKAGERQEREWSDNRADNY